MATGEEKFINLEVLYKYPRRTIGGLVLTGAVVVGGWSLITGKGCPTYSLLDFINPATWACNVGAGAGNAARGVDAATIDPWQDQLLQNGIRSRQQSRRVPVTSAPPGAAPPPAIQPGSR